MRHSIWHRQEEKNQTYIDREIDRFRLPVNIPYYLAVTFAAIFLLCG